MKSSSELITLFDFNSIKKFISKAKKFGCKEALVMSGESPDEFNEVKRELCDKGYDKFFDYLLDACKNLIKEKILPHTNVGNLTYEELEELRKYNASLGLMLESSNPNLQNIGSVHEKSPSKQPSTRIEFIKNAGKLKIPFTSGILLGIGEDTADRIEDLMLINRLNEKYGHIQEIIIQNFVEKPNISYRPKNLITIEEVIKTAGLAKIIVKNSINIQVPPNLITGYEKEFLKVGINDFGGISPFTKDEINPYKPWPEIEYLEKICKDAGYVLKERLPIYDKFIKNPNFISPEVKNVIDLMNR